VGDGEREGDADDDGERVAGEDLLRRHPRAAGDDLEVLEINEPAEYGTWNLAEPPAPWR
jgi:hypothetical protein